MGKVIVVTSGKGGVGKTTSTACGRNSAPSRAYFDAARRLAGEEVEMTIPTDRKSLFTKLFWRRAA
jgi:septum site-determining protein MinD